MAAALAAAALASLLAVPARALPAPYVTPDTTVAQMRANEGIAGSGFNTWDRGTLFPEQPWQYGNWTLRRFVGPTVDDAVAGLNLVIDNYNRGLQVTYPLYTAEEIAADPTRKGVELYYFPGERPNGKYALVLSGNMLERTSRTKEASGAVSQLHEMGYTAFILKYRAGHEVSKNGNYNDLVRAVEYITAHAGQFGVRPDQYALVGFSAGGHLCGMFGTDRMGAPTGWGTKTTACPSPARCCWPTPSSIICTASRASSTSTTARCPATTWPRGTTTTTSSWTRR